MTTKKTKTLVLTENTPIQTKQLLRLLQVTPKQHRFTRPAKGGGNWDYVTGAYVKQTLNEVFGWLWSFDIINMKESHGQAVCQGKLTINKPDGNPLVWKTDIGKADIKYKTEERKDDKGRTIMDAYNKYPKKFPTDIPLDYGNDEKAAATDCLKRCAFQLGIASDIYDSKKEFQELRADDYLEVIETAEESVKLDDANLAKINNSKTHDELVVVCREIIKEKGEGYRHEVTKLYGLRKQDIENGNI